MNTYAVVYFGSMFVALHLALLIVRVARSLRLLDRPGVRKVHHWAVPRIGGVVIVFSTLALTLPVLALDNVVGQAFRQASKGLVVLLGAGLLVFFVGLVDDIRGLRARFRLLAHIAAALAVCAAGTRISGIYLSGWVMVDFGWFAWPVTVLWIVGITNAVNFIDGLDGLAAGISAVACGVIAIFAIHFGQPVMAVLMLALLGSLCGFLFFNFNPANIFLGDCGSTFLGFVIASASVLCAVKSATLVGLALPALALGLPIFDTLFSMLRRILQRRSLTAPDRGHIHHRLIAMGMKQRQAVVVMHLVTLLAAGLGLFMMVTRNAGTIVLFACVLGLLLLLFGAAGSLRLRETLATIRRNLAVAREAREQKQRFENAELLFQDATSFDGWWRAVGRAAEQMDLLRVSMNVTNRDGTTRTLLWRRPRQAARGGQKFSATVPVRQRRSAPLETAVEVAIDGSLESAGRRVTFFARLMDEHSIADLPAAGSAAAAGDSASPGEPSSLRPRGPSRRRIPPLSTDPGGGEPVGESQA